jgi:hypothetical protein
VCTITTLAGSKAGESQIPTRSQRSIELNLNMTFGMEATPDLPGCILLVVDLNCA